MRTLAAETPLHEVSNRHVKTLSVAFRYAFYQGRKAIKASLRLAGDYPHHPFRGNQWTGKVGPFSEKLVEMYGTTNSPEDTRFLLPDGRRIKAERGTMHGQMAMEVVGSQVEEKGVGSLEDDIAAFDALQRRGLEALLNEGTIRYEAQAGIEVSKPLTRPQAEIVSKDFQTIDLYVDVQTKGTDVSTNLGTFVSPDQLIEHVDAVLKGARPKPRRLGGVGSGNFGHAGRPGKVGGSTSLTVPADALDKRTETVTLYHSSTSESAPTFAAFFGTKAFYDTFPKEFGNNVYELKLPPSAKVIDLNRDTPAAHEFKARMIEHAYPNDSAAKQIAADYRAGKITMDSEKESDFYDDWTDKDNIVAVLRRTRGADAARYQDEYLLSEEMIHDVGGAARNRNLAASVEAVAVEAIASALRRTLPRTLQIIAADGGEVAVELMLPLLRMAGDKPGHQFHGNQWTDGQSLNLDKDGYAPDGTPGPAIARRGGALWLYRATGHADLNAKLIQGEELDDDEQKIVNQLDAAMRPLQKDVTLYRNTDVVTENNSGYLSTSLDPNISTFRSDTPVRIDVPAGTLAIRIGDYYARDSEQEVILARGTQLQKIADDHYAVVSQRTLGDKPGHVFHGNQWTDGYGGTRADFHSVGDTQRGEPERAMIDAQMLMGGGVMNVAVEHIGDLTHRMTESPTFETAGYEFVKEKVDKATRWLNNPYGFEREFEDNIRNNAAYHKVDEAQFRQQVYAALNRYADAHEKVPVFNEAQRVARDAAIALGRRRFADVSDALATLKSHLETREDWIAYAHEGLRALGDRPGHPFHGNQWTDFQGTAEGVDTHTVSAKIAAGAKTGQPFEATLYRGVDPEESDKVNRIPSQFAVGEYRTPFPEVAATYGTEVKSLPTKLRNPYVFTLGERAYFKELKDEFGTHRPEDITRKLQSEGYDGLIVKNVPMNRGEISMRDSIEVIVFKPDVKIRAAQLFAELMIKQRILAPRKIIDFRFDRTHKAVVDWAKKHAGELIEDVTQVSKDRIRRAIVELEQTGDWDRAVEKIDAAVGDEERADLIARNESHLAASEGQRQAWYQAVDEGYLTGKERRTWIAVGDEKTCPICSVLDGKTTKLDQPYPGELVGPPAHTLCRCTEGLTR